MAVLSQSDIDEYLNETVGNNYRILSDVARGLKKERDKLHNQVINILISSMAMITINHD
jgi:sulfur transfer complex TusBCD TusB component (DsrH family)